MGCIQNHHVGTTLPRVAAMGARSTEDASECSSITTAFTSIFFYVASFLLTCINQSFVIFLKKKSIHVL